MLQTRPAQPETRRRPAVSASALTYPVALLMAEIGDACAGPADAMGQRIAHALRVAAAMPGLLTAELRAPRPGCYARHSIASDPAGRFTLLSIVWAPGQFSPPHAHDTWCAYAVAENTLTETLYEFDVQSGKAIAAGTAQREPGFACFAPAGLEQIHRLGNASGASVAVQKFAMPSGQNGSELLNRHTRKSLSASVPLNPKFADECAAKSSELRIRGTSAISIHAYGVEGSRVGTHVNRLMDVAERER